MDSEQLLLLSLPLLREIRRPRGVERIFKQQVLHSKRKKKREALCPSRDFSTIKGLTRWRTRTKRRAISRRRVELRATRSNSYESQQPRVVERRNKLFDAPRIDLSAGESFEPCRSRFPWSVTRPIHLAHSCYHVSGVRINGSAVIVVKSKRSNDR